MNFHAIRISGGILTEEFLKALTEPEALKELGLSPEEVRDRFYALLGLYERVGSLFHLTDTSKAREAWLLPFFRALGWNPAYNRGHLQVADQAFPISHRGFPEENAPPLHLVAAEPDLRPSRREKSPQALLQAYLNLHPEHDWGILAAPWEALDLADPAYRPLLEGLRRLGFPPPDEVGEDLMQEGRIVGQGVARWGEKRLVPPGLEGFGLAVKPDSPLEAVVQYLKA